MKGVSEHCCTDQTICPSKHCLHAVSQDIMEFFIRSVIDARLENIELGYPTFKAFNQQDTHRT